MQTEPTEVKTQIEDITPEMATEWLKAHNAALDNHSWRQRPINPDVVMRYASDMFADNWLVTHQGIAFSDQGHLLDGQHRLEAIKAANSTIRMMVTRGLPEQIENGVSRNTLDTIDCGRARSIKQQLDLSHGIKEAARVAAVCKRIISFALEDSRVHVSVAQTLAVNDIFGAAISRLLQIGNSRLRRSTILAPLSLYATANREKGDAFAHSFHRLENLSVGSPVLALHQWMDKHGKQSNYAKRNAWTVVATCLMAYDSGKEISPFAVNGDSVDWLSNLLSAELRKIIENTGGAMVGRKSP